MPHGPGLAANPSRIRSQVAQPTGTFFTPCSSHADLKMSWLQGSVTTITTQCSPQSTYLGSIMPRFLPLAGPCIRVCTWLLFCCRACPRSKPFELNHAYSPSYDASLGPVAVPCSTDHAPPPSRLHGVVFGANIEMVPLPDGSQNCQFGHPTG